MKLAVEQVLQQQGAELSEEFVEILKDEISEQYEMLKIDQVQLPVSPKALSQKSEEDFVDDCEEQTPEDLVRKLEKMPDFIVSKDLKRVFKRPAMNKRCSCGKSKKSYKKCECSIIDTQRTKDFIDNVKNPNKKKKVSPRQS